VPPVIILLPPRLLVPFVLLVITVLLPLLPARHAALVHMPLGQETLHAQTVLLESTPTPLLQLHVQVVLRELKHSWQELRFVLIVPLVTIAVVVPLHALLVPPVIMPRVLLPLPAQHVLLEGMPPLQQAHALRVPLESIRSLPQALVRIALRVLTPCLEPLHVPIAITVLSVPAKEVQLAPYAL
jgi:hypothetical protein